MSVSTEQNINSLALEQLKKLHAFLLANNVPKDVIITDLGTFNSFDVKLPGPGNLKIFIGSYPADDQKAKFSFALFANEEEFITSSNAGYENVDDNERDVHDFYTNEAVLVEIVRLADLARNDEIIDYKQGCALDPLVDLPHFISDDPDFSNDLDDDDDEDDEVIAFRVECRIRAEMRNESKLPGLCAH